MKNDSDPPKSPQVSSPITDDEFHRLFSDGELLPSEDTPFDPKWEANGFVRSNDPDLDEFSNWYQQFLPEKMKAHDLASKVEGDTFWRNLHKTSVAVAYKQFNPVYQNRSGLKFVKVVEDEYDFPWSQEWQDKHQSTTTTGDDISDHFHASWALDKWIPKEEAKRIRNLMRKQTGGSSEHTNYLMQSPFYNTEGRKSVKIIKDGKHRRNYLMTKGQMVVYSVRDIEAAYTTIPDQVDQMLVGAKKIITTANEPKKALVLSPKGNIKFRNINMFNVVRLIAYRLFFTDKWSLDAVIELCVKHGSDLPLSEKEATARSIFNYCEDNSDKIYAPTGNRANYADLRWYKHRKYVGECLVDFADRIGISYAMAKKYSREKKLARDITGYFMFETDRCDPIEYISSMNKEIDVVSSDCMDTDRIPLDPDIHLFENMNLIEVEIIPPTPRPRSISSYTTRELMEMFNS